MQRLDGDWAVRWVLATTQEMAAHRDHLGELDRRIGDGDHGENMQRGFDAAAQRLRAEAPAGVAEVLLLLAATLMSTVGGAAGALYGTAFLRAGKVAGGLTGGARVGGDAVPSDGLDGPGLVAVLDAALGGLVDRGKAAVGDKTMVDAWAPAVAAARAAANAGSVPATVLAVAAEAAAAGAVSTEPLVAAKGRASYLGERSRGHRDPGAVSSALILRCAAEVAA